MWAHGVPTYVLSSLHATSEGGGKDGKTYNRLVSTLDGHSEKWLHEVDYAECQKVCRQKAALTADSLTTVGAAVRKLAGFADASDLDVSRFVDEYVSFGRVTSNVEGAGRLGEMFAALLEQKALTTTTGEDSCHIYVDFRRRFGGDRAVCLR
jgi:hypothetical protein